MTPADRRISELIDRWVASIDLHLKYAELNDADYARAQPWPKHDRPTRWVLEVARQKVLELKEQCESRQSMGDGKFSESLELMAFLANLVGIQHIQRFIPLADPTRANAASSESQTVEAPTIVKAGPMRHKRSGDDTTREMPRLKAQAAPKATASAEPKLRAEAGKGAARDSQQAPVEASKKAAAPGDITSKIITDAIRLLKWGKPWHELAELIARIADRPPEAEIRKVLRTNKAEIEAKAAPG